MKNKNSASIGELLTLLHRERPRWEIELIVDQVRQKIQEENKVKDLDKFLELHNILLEKHEQLHRTLAVWQNVTITAVATLFAILISLLMK